VSLKFAIDAGVLPGVMPAKAGIQILPGFRVAPAIAGLPGMTLKI